MMNPTQICRGIFFFTADRKYPFLVNMCIICTEICHLQDEKQQKIWLVNTKPVQILSENTFFSSNKQTVDVEQFKFHSSHHLLVCSLFENRRRCLHSICVHVFYCLIEIRVLFDFQCVLILPVSFVTILCLYLCQTSVVTTQICHLCWILSPSSLKICCY